MNIAVALRAREVRKQSDRDAYEWRSRRPDSPGRVIRGREQPDSGAAGRDDDRGEAGTDRRAVGRRGFGRGGGGPVAGRDARRRAAEVRGVRGARAGTPDTDL